VATDHVQSRAVVIVSAPWPPGGGNDDGLLATVTLQRFDESEGAVMDVSVFVQAVIAIARNARPNGVRLLAWSGITSPARFRIANSSPVRLTDEVTAADTISRMTLDEAQRLASRLRDELGRAIIGQQAVVHDILTAFFAGGHCLLRGVPGLAKTLLIKTLAQAIHLKFNRIQFTPDLMPSDIIGTEVIEEDRGTGRREIRFIPGPVFANVILADEINRTPPKTQAALL